MDNIATSQYTPDYTVTPGEVLGYVNVSRTELARFTGMGAKHIIAILKGRVITTPGAAIKLECVLGMPADYWFNLLEACYHSWSDGGVASELRASGPLSK